MSTRSRIGIKRKDGSIDSIYCHHDGYLEYVGRMLYEYYKNTHKVEHLINLGDISSLGEHVFPNELEEHSFDYGKNQKDVCVAYARDRGEIIHQLHSNDMDSFIEYCSESDQEYAYLYDEESQKWLFAPIPYNCKNMEFESLRDALVNKNIILDFEV